MKDIFKGSIQEAIKTSEKERQRFVYCATTGPVVDKDATEAGLDELPGILRRVRITGQSAKKVISPLRKSFWEGTINEQVVAQNKVFETKKYYSSSAKLVKKDSNPTNQKAAASTPEIDVFKSI